MTKLSLPGTIVPAEPEDAAEAKALADFGITIERHQEVVGIVRGEPLTRETFDADDEHDVIELQFDAGVVQYMRVEDLVAESVKTRAARDGDVVEVPVEFHRGSTTDRGLFDWAARRVRVFRVSDGLTGVVTGALADAAAQKVINRFDNQQSPAPALYRVNAEGELLETVTASEQLDVARPWLLFIHGTVSSTEGSFGGLFGEKDLAGSGAILPKRALTQEWKQLYQFYGGRLLALQHKTLSVSPVDNAVEVAALLPQGAKLHLVTHSRGGLVGELLSLGTVDAKRFRVYETAYGVERGKQLRGLVETLQRKNFTVEKFVRVACPARGTILASDRLDLYLSILLNLFGAIPALRVSPLYALLKGTTIDLVRLRTDATKLPGLQAQMPASALIHFLNQGLQSKGNLAVIAGDAEGDTFWQRLKLLGTDVFYLQEHDLVVNTDAMFGGMGRSDPAYGFYHRGGTVNHFSYFRNARTRARLYSWLTSKAPDSEFTRFDPTKPGINIPPSRAAVDDLLPVLIVVPDVLGSILGPDKSTPFWPDVTAIARTGFTLHNAAYQPQGLVNGYEPLVTGWGGTHRIVEFPWDWRKPTAAAAPLLAREILKHAVQGRDVSVIAHGAGGLLVHQLQLGADDDSKKAWAALRRALLLGTPHFGMFAAVDWCSPQSRLALMLSLADGVLRPDAIARQFADCAAVVETAPDAYLQQPELWEAAGAIKPAAELLQKAAALRARLATAPKDDKLVAIAGRANETLVDADVTGMVAYSPSGDGRVTVEQLHPEIPRWRVEASHGELPSYAGAFGAYRDLLEKKETATLSRPQNVVSPVSRRQRPNDDTLLFPQTDDLLTEAMGTSRDRTLQTADYPLTLSVTHGDLSVARYPLAVGHYLGDMIVSAEAKLDCQLDRRLSRRFQLGLYPGAAGTVEVIRVPDTVPPGALIIGLGQVGTVTPEVVRRGIMAAAVRYALSLAEERGRKQEGGAWRSAAFSAVIIGTKGGNAMTVESSIVAILRGAVDANRMLRAQGMWDEVRIDAIELIELYEQRAIATAYASRRAAAHVRTELEREERIEVIPILRPTRSGQYRVPLDDENTAWWQRLVITIDSDERDPARRANIPMRFVVLGERARVEAQLQCRERNATDSLIESAIATRSFDPNLSGALFELLVPNDIKTASDQAPSVVLILDPDTASYPWELLSDPFTRDAKPYSVRTGMVRQFVSVHFREAPRYALENRALVVGDTHIAGPVGTAQENYKELPGAQAEARAVATILGAANFETKLLIRGTASEVQTNLFTRPYRILHLAGHGRYDKDRPEESGMVLGMKNFLTACQLRQLRTVPDLVFLNCCFLGRLDDRLPDFSRLPVDGKPHLLAASIANELISMGVKAIVAAGWAVDDAAAVTFAATFYEEMLVRRRPFGDAVRQARAEVFRKHGATNTWGAYQCYGNPGFMLGSMDGDARADEAFAPCSQREYIDLFRSINAEARDLGQPPNEQAVAALRKRLAETAAGVPAQWNDAELLTLVGRAWRDIGDYGKAVDALDKALMQPRAAMPIEAVGMLANMLVRLGRQEKDPAKAEQHLGRAKTLLDALLILGRSSERLSLLGSLYKKRAAMTPAGPDRRQLLVEAAKAYEEAVAIDQKANTIDPYPILNAVDLAWLLDPGAASLAAQLDRAEPVVQAKTKSDDYFERVGIANHALTKALLTGTFDVGAIANAYSAAARNAPQGELQSTFEHLEFLADMLAGDKSRKKVEKTLRDLVKKLRT
ncbi:MAG TPA: CHAT domain-containing protein [Thermoanaerobaculia bacterium]